MSNSFGKSYKLCSQILIEQVYKKGVEIKSFPLVAKYSFLPLPKGSAPFQVLVVVPKKKFKHATTRNQIKRYIRESLRLNKHGLESFLIEKKLPLVLSILYLGNAETDFHYMEKSMQKLMHQLINELNT